MTANVVISRSEYDSRLSDSSYTELENLTETNNLKSDQYTYYQVGSISRKSLLIVAVWED